MIKDKFRGGGLYLHIDNVLGIVKQIFFYDDEVCDVRVKDKILYEEEVGNGTVKGIFYNI